jgi:hypothetical protein
MRKTSQPCAFATLRFLSNSSIRQGGYEAEINRCVIRTLAKGMSDQRDLTQRREDAESQ